MSGTNGLILRDGLPQAAAAVAVAAAAAILIAVAAGGFGFAGRLAVAAVVLLVVALVLGSARGVGLTTLPMLGAAVAAFSTAAQPLWIRSILIGTLWYIASELAWDAIERRSGAVRSPELDYRRSFEVSTVVGVALTITASGFLASRLAPTRTLLSVGIVVIGLFIAIGMATRHVDEAGPDSG